MLARFYSQLPKFAFLSAAAALIFGLVVLHATRRHDVLTAQLSLRVYGDPHLRYCGPEFVPDWCRQPMGFFFDRLVDVKLRGCVIDSSLRHNLYTCRSLRDIDFDRTNTTDEMLRELHHMDSLRVLSIRNAPVTDECVNYIPKGITYLNMSGTSVGDRALYRLREFTSLKVLFVCDTAITGEGLQHLEANTNLEYLEVTGTTVSFEAIERLRRAIPKCRVVATSPK